jgi:nucleoid DNA-binding protein
MTATTKRELTLQISEQTGITQVLAKKVVQNVFDTIINTLVESGRLELRDFGVFQVKHRLARKARNPLTDEIIKVPAKDIVTFKPGKAMEEKIQKRFQKKRAK